MKKYWLLLLPIAAIAVGQTLSKFGVQQAEETRRIINIFIISGYVLLVLRAAIWIWVVRKVKLSLAYPVLSITYVLILLISYYIFNEPLTIRKILGAVLIMAGVFLVGYGELRNRKSGS